MVLGARVDAALSFLNGTDMAARKPQPSCSSEWWIRRHDRRKWKNWSPSTNLWKRSRRNSASRARLLARAASPVHRGRLRGAFQQHEL